MYKQIYKRLQIEFYQDSKETREKSQMAKGNK